MHQRHDQTYKTGNLLCEKKKRIYITQLFLRIMRNIITGVAIKALLWLYRSLGLSFFFFVFLQAHF